MYARLPAGCTVPSVPTGPPPAGVTYTRAGAVILLSNADELEGLLDGKRECGPAKWQLGGLASVTRCIVSLSATVMAALVGLTRTKPSSKMRWKIPAADRRGVGEATQYISTVKTRDHFDEPSSS